MFEKAPGISVVAETSTVIDTVAHVRARSPLCDVLIFDPDMPGRSGLEIIRQIKDITPSLGVLILTARDEPGFACRAVRAGANGYQTKTGPFSELLTAVRRVASGRPYISAGVAEQLVLELSTQYCPDGHEALTDREKQVFDLLLRGVALSKIGQELQLSVKTISTYKARIMEKMNLSSIAELMHYAFEHNLIAFSPRRERVTLASK